MKPKFLLLTLPLLVIILACSLATPAPQADPNTFNTMVAQTAQAAQIQTAAAQPPSSGPTAPPVETQTGPAPESDLPFHIDCSALDPARQADCDAYLAATRDRVYPLLRELTGTSLSSCYDAVYYTIVTDAQLAERQGEADENRITYSLRASLDAAPAPLHDAHELLHTINFCNGALDQHIFHGAFESYVDLALTGVEWQSPGRERIADWLETKLLPGLQALGEATPAPGAGAPASFDACVEIYGSLVTILYYDSGIEPIKQLYRATINPGSEYDPNPRLLALFGPSLGRQFQAVVNALKQNPKYPLAVSGCGLE